VVLAVRLVLALQAALVAQVKSALRSTATEAPALRVKRAALAAAVVEAQAVLAFAS